MLDTTAEGSGERRIGPSVSRDKWLNHARTKLQRGYVLIVGKGKRTANFYSRDKGYEMCAFEVARALVGSGEVVASGEHHLGTVYTLVAIPSEVVPSRPAPTPADVDDGDDFGLEEEEAEETFDDDEEEVDEPVDDEEDVEEPVDEEPEDDEED